MFTNKDEEQAKSIETEDTFNEEDDALENGIVPPVSSNATVFVTATTRTSLLTVTFH
jgi:hypothetical protein